MDGALRRRDVRGRARCRSHRQRRRDAVPSHDPSSQPPTGQGDRSAMGNRRLSPAVRARAGGDVVAGDGGGRRDARRTCRRGDPLQHFGPAPGRTHACVRASRLAAPSAGSCPHGVERWRSDCGCRVHGDRATHQRWRAQLRNALDWLAAELHGVFEREGGTLFFADPWTVRDVYGAVLGAPDDNVTAFIGERLRHPDDRSALARARELLELERHALRMFTSCGWFFDDIAGLESLIVLRSAARASELAGTDAARRDGGLLERLALAPSNDPAVGTGRELYLQGVKAAPAGGVPI